MLVDSSLQGYRLFQDCVSIPRKLDGLPHQVEDDYS